MKNIYHQNGLNQSDSKISPKRINGYPQIRWTHLLAKERANLGLIFLIGYD